MFAGDGRCPLLFWTPGAAIGAGFGVRLDTQTIAHVRCDGAYVGWGFSHYLWTVSVWESEHEMRRAAFFWRRGRAFRWLRTDAGARWARRKLQPSSPQFSARGPIACRLAATEGPRRGPARSVPFIAFAFYPASWVCAAQALRRWRGWEGRRGETAQTHRRTAMRSKPSAPGRAVRRRRGDAGAGAKRRPKGDAAERRRPSAWARREAGWARRAGADLICRMLARPPGGASRDRGAQRRAPCIGSFTP